MTSSFLFTFGAEEKSASLITTIYIDKMKVFMRLLIFFIFLTTSLFAQQPDVQLISLGEGNPVLQDYVQVLRSQAVLKSNHCISDTLSLPFFDDFANNPNGYYPDCAKWENDQQAYINQGMAYQPPSIGVATLDGLNSVGEPYNRNAGNSTPNPADTLSSQAIDLSGFTAANNLVLSYFYQPEGLSDRPEEGDSLILEFLDTAGNWDLIHQHAGVPLSVSTLVRIEFDQNFILIQDAQYLHAGFKFRFRNLATITGNNDHWHLDYIYLDQNRTDTTAPVYYNDVCYTQPPNSPLDPYTAIPWRHFDATAWSGSIKMQLFNHSNITGILDRTYTVEDTSNGVNLLTNTLPTTPTYSPSPTSDDSFEGVISSTFSNFNPTEKTVLKSTYRIDAPGAFQNSAPFFNNDTACRYTELSNYYAYDDGTAETRIIASSIGTQLAVEFTALADDTLRGIYIHMPYFRNRDNEQDFINVKVWVDDIQVSSNEVFSRDIYRLRYEEGFNGMHYVELADFTGTPFPIALSAGQTFYIGWQQASAIEVPVGFDRSTNNRSRTFKKVGGNPWTNIIYEGTIMIRPLLSPNSDPFIIPTEKTPLPNQEIELQLFPNPTTGHLNIACEACNPDTNFTIAIYTQLGQQLRQQAFTPQLHVADLPKGVYQFILLRKGIIVTQQRFVKI